MKQIQLNGKLYQKLINISFEFEKQDFIFHYKIYISQKETQERKSVLIPVLDIKQGSKQVFSCYLVLTHFKSK